MAKINSNELGISVASIGGLILVCSIIFGFIDGFHLFEKPYLIAIGIGICLIGGGLYIRVVGKFFNLFGKLLILLSILHAILLHLIGFRSLAFGLENIDNVVAFEVLIGFIGMGLIICGSFLVRTREQEAQDRIIAEEERRARNQRFEQERIRHSASVPHCPNCGAEAGGGVIGGNRIIHCLTCGCSFCGKCARGLVNKACPSCGESSQRNIRFS